MQIENLGTAAADIAMRAAARYLQTHQLEADSAALTECLRAWCKIKLPEALADAKDAIEANMGDAAVATFQATMTLAGIEAAKEAGFPKAE